MQLQLPNDAGDHYKPSKELLAAINTALFLQRPLLLSGEPGTGKTECADFVTRQLCKSYPQLFNLEKAFRFNTKSMSQSSDLYYYYDAVAHFGDKTNKTKESFISFNSLGVALLATHKSSRPEWEQFINYKQQMRTRQAGFGSVVLIDEIDKAPRDFPNDLLAELEKPPFKFNIKELADFEIEQKQDVPIFIIITSNNEKGLPDAFLRRCVFHHINFPEADELLKIVESNLKRKNDHFQIAIQRFLEFRKQNIAKKPATSELIDWIVCLEERNLLNNNLAVLKNADEGYRQKIVETFGIIAKSRTDFETLSKEIAG